MTIPNFDYLQTNDSLPDFSYLSRPGYIGDDGFLNYLGNLASNTMRVLAVQDSPNPIDQGVSAVANLIYGNTPEQRRQLKVIKDNLQAANATKGDAWEQVKNDLSPKNFFSKLSDFTDSVGNMSLSDIVKNFPKAIVETVASPLEALTGLDLGQENAPVLNPEARAAQIKNTAAIALSSLAGGVSRFAAGKLLIPEAVSSLPEELKLASTPALNAAQQSGKIGLFGRALVKGAVEGGTAGATFGAVSGANTEDQLNGILTGLLFAPLGMATEVLGTKVSGKDNVSIIQSKARDIFTLRQLQYSPDKSLFDLSDAVSALATSNGIPEAAEKVKKSPGRIEVKKNPEVSTQDLSKLLPDGEPGVNIETNLPGDSFIKIAARDENGKPIGLLTIKKTGEESADVFTVYVDPAVRRQGIATRLYDAAESAGYKLRSGESGLTPEGKAFVENRLKTQLTTPFDKLAEDIISEYSKNLFDEFKSITEVPENVLGFEDNFNRFAQLRSIEANDAKVLRQNFLDRIHDEVGNALNGNERGLYKKVVQDLEKKQQVIVESGSDKLRKSAIENNTYFDQADAGVITLRDYDTNKVVGKFHSVEDAQKYLDNIGNPPDAIHLDGNGKVPPTASKAPAIPPNLGPLSHPPAGWLDRKYALWGSRLSFATANPTLFKQWDTLFNTQFHANVFNVVDKAAKLADGKRSVYLKRLQDLDNLIRNTTQAQREHIFNWMETRSIQEHEKFGGPGNRQLSPQEIALANMIKDADLTAAYRYKNAMRGVSEKDFPSVDPQMQKQFNITPKELNALTLLSIAERNQITKLSVGSSVHYARLLQNPELALTRAEYAKKFKLSANQLSVGSGLDKYFNDLAETAGISKDKLLFNYITHARLYENGSLPDALAKFALDKPTEEFYAALNRTGELDQFERDPIRAALRYTNAMFNTMYLSPAINQATDALKLELGKLPAGAGLKVERDAMRYLRDVRHFPGEGDKYADAAINHFVKNTGIDIEKGVARKWVNGINEVFTIAAQGARPWAGIRDFYSNTSKYYIKWGASDAARMLELGANADLDALRQSGLIENYTQLGLNSAVDEAASALSQAGSRLKRTIDKTSQVALKLSGQQYVNDMARAGSFLITREKVASMGRKLVNGDFGKLDKPESFQKAYNAIQLERYSIPVREEFDRLIKTNKIEDAANYLGNQNIQETFGNYANANHPSGWNNNFGRLVGKFGQWSINHRDYIVSLASRGTREQRLAALGRLAITESTIAGAATLFAVNLSNFYSLPGMYFKGGPAGDLFYTAYNAMFGRGMEQSDAIRRIKNLLPYDQVNEKFKGSIIVPFSFTLADLAEGLEMANNGDTMGGLARIGGVRPQNENYTPSQWEQTIGDIVTGR